MSAFATLRGLTRKQARTLEARENCDLCGAPLFHRHQHLIDVASRRLVCSCDACSILFHRNGETKYKAVPRTARLLDGFHLTEGQWDSLLIPISLAFFVKHSPGRRVLAFYPSPAGPTESSLTLEAWTEIVEDNPVLVNMESDVEALLVNRLDESGEYYIAPIDKCYELVGVIRANWHGLSGGDAMWTKIRQFFSELKENSRA
jgi:hypothetical protein